MLALSPRVLKTKPPRVLLIDWENQKDREKENRISRVEKHMRPDRIDQNLPLFGLRSANCVIVEIGDYTETGDDEFERLSGMIALGK